MCHEDELYEVTIQYTEERAIEELEDQYDMTEGDENFVDMLATTIGSSMEAVGFSPGYKLPEGYEFADEFIDLDDYYNSDGNDVDFGDDDDDDIEEDSHVQSK